MAWDILPFYIADFTAGPPNVPGINSVSLGDHVAVRGFTTQRGRQYELDQAEAGTMTLNIVDENEALNPVNASSPWNSGGNSLLPYRCVQVGAWCNPTVGPNPALYLTGNLLTDANIAPGATFNYDPTFEDGEVWVGDFGTNVALTISTAQHWQGARSLQCVFSSTSDMAGWGLWTVPGKTYTHSCYVFVPTGRVVTMSVETAPGMVVYGTSASSTTGAWQRLMVTFTATTAVAAATFKVTSGTTPATVYLDAPQLELAASASAFVDTGPVFYPVFTGYIERYPQTWDTQGRRGIKQLECVDALSVLSRTVPAASYQATILADGPSAYIPLDDASVPQTVLQPQGGQPILGYTSLGTNGSVDFAGDQFLDGSNAVSVTQQNDQPPVGGNTDYVTYLGTMNGAVPMNPQACTIEVWVRFVAGLPYLGAGFVQPGEDVNHEQYGPTYLAGWYGYTPGVLSGRYTDPAGGVATIPYSSVWGYPRGIWHHRALVFTGASSITEWINASTHNTGAIVGGVSSNLSITNFFVDAQTYHGEPVTTLSVANMAIYPYALSQFQLAAHYQRGIGYFGETYGARANRLLGQYWGSRTNVDSGQSTLSADFYYFAQGNQQSLLQDLQDMSATEVGFVWCDTSGTINVDGRATRYIYQPQSAFVFSDIPADLAAGAAAYDTVAYDYDPTYVYSQAQLTSDATGDIINVVNSTSQDAYGQRILNQTMYMASDWDVLQAANFYVQRYAVPAGGPGSSAPPRISALSLNPSSQPTIWYQALSLDMGGGGVAATNCRVTVKHQTAAGTLIAGDYYTEQITHTVDCDAGTWTVDTQMSPVWHTQVWVLGDTTNGVLGSTTTTVY